MSTDTPGHEREEVNVDAQEEHEIRPLDTKRVPQAVACVLDPELKKKTEAWERAIDPAVMFKELETLHLVTPRKRRLFAVACARRVQHLMKFPESIAAIDAAELFANGKIDVDTLAGFERGARQASSRAVKEAHSVWALGPSAPVARAAWVAVWASCAAENTCDRDNSAAVPGSPEAGFQGCLAIRTAQVASWAQSVAQELVNAPEETPEADPALFFSFLRSLKNTVQRTEQAMKDGDPLCETVVQAQLVRTMFGNPYSQGYVLPAWRTETVMQIALAIEQDKSYGDLPILGDALEDAGCTSTILLSHLRSGDIDAHPWSLDLVLSKE